MFAGERLTHDKAEKLVRWYFYGGFLGLPWLWAVNYIYFRRYAAQNELIQRYVKRSMWCAIVGCILMAAWMLYAQLGLASDSELWIIHPVRSAEGKEGSSTPWQSGFFADTVYQES